MLYVDSPDLGKAAFRKRPLAAFAPVERQAKQTLVCHSISVGIFPTEQSTIVPPGIQHV